MGHPRYVSLLERFDQQRWYLMGLKHRKSGGVDHGLSSMGIETNQIWVLNRMYMELVPNSNMCMDYQIVMYMGICFNPPYYIPP
jgi:hypothetical protein